MGMSEVELMDENMGLKGFFGFLDWGYEEKLWE